MYARTRLVLPVTQKCARRVKLCVESSVPALCRYKTSGSSHEEAQPPPKQTISRRPRRKAEPFHWQPINHRKSTPKLLPKVSDWTEFPDLSAYDELLDPKHTRVVRSGPTGPVVGRYTQWAPYDDLQESEEDDELEDGSSPRNQIRSEKPAVEDIDEVWEKDRNAAGRSQREMEEDEEDEDDMEEEVEDEPADEEELDPEQEQWKQEREAADARLPYPRAAIRDLHRYPLIVKRVVQQTPKGRMASFFAMVAVGNGEGVMGIGQGKDSESTVAAESKAYTDAIKRLDTVARFEDRTIFTEAYIKLGSTKITMWPRPAGFGLAVNPYIHQICKAAGIRDLSAKVIGSRNGMQVVKAVTMLLHGGSTPLGFGDGVGGKGRRLEAKEGIRPREVVERERGRKLIEGSGWL